MIQTKKISFSDLTEEDQNSCCRAVLSDVRQMFEDPAVKDDFQKWLIEYRQRQQRKIHDQSIS